MSHWEHRCDGFNAVLNNDSFTTVEKLTALSKVVGTSGIEQLEEYEDDLLVTAELLAHQDTEDHRAEADTLLAAIYAMADTESIWLGIG